jgi:hypothetical protein
MTELLRRETGRDAQHLQAPLNQAARIGVRVTMVEKRQ